MDEFQFFSKTVSGRGYAAAKYSVRTAITAVEREIKILPADIVRPDGSLDLYEDVQTLFNPVFRKGQPAVQCGGWLGYIPLNDRYALEINARVPIDNLERLIGLAAGYSPEVLKAYTRYFSHTTEQPAVLIDILTDQLLASFDHAWEAGLVKDYQRRERIGTSPVGKIDPFGSAWRSVKAGRPTAVSNSFVRTKDFGPNRVLRFAFEKMLRLHLETPDSASQKLRVLRIQRSLDRLGGVARPLATEASPSAIARYIKRLPVHHERYADALMLSQLVINDVGLAIRGSDGFAILPTILINMSEVFEQYARLLLANHLSTFIGAAVLDGNKAGAGGAKECLFEGLRTGLKNPPVTPDMVVTVNGTPRLIIDAKYKFPPDIPDRPDRNQVIGYGARYACNNVMVLYAGRGKDKSWVERVGNVGAYTLYAGHIDLEADQIEDEERSFAKAVASVLNV